MNDEKTFKSNGKGVLSYANIESVCKYGKTVEIDTVLGKVQYSMEQSIEKKEKMELGFELLGVDYTDLYKKYGALLSVKATNKQIKDILGKNVKQIKEYDGLLSYIGYLEMIENKLNEAKGL